MHTQRKLRQAGQSQVTKLVRDVHGILNVPLLMLLPSASEEDMLPDVLDVEPLRLATLADVDGKAETVLIPVFGGLVPFHISAIKNVAKNEESGLTYLRINFVAPTATGANVRCPRPRSGYRSDKSSRCGPEPTCHANHAHACTYDICTHICTHMPHATCSCCHMPIHMQMRMTHASHCARCDLDHRRVCPRSRGQMITSSVRSL